MINPALPYWNKVLLLGNITLHSQKEYNIKRVYYSYRKLSFFENIIVLNATFQFVENKIQKK